VTVRRATRRETTGRYAFTALLLLYHTYSSRRGGLGRYTFTLLCCCFTTHTAVDGVRRGALYV
jgi:hypothetical protein